jgi:hypothetical protein
VDGGQAVVLQDIDDDNSHDDCVNAPYTTEAQFPKTIPLTFKNFIYYCHDFASAVWKQSEPDRLLCAGLIIGIWSSCAHFIGISR